MKQKTFLLLFFQRGKTMTGSKKTVNQYANGTHPEQEAIEGYVKATIPLVEMQDVKEHCDECGFCQRLVIETMKATAKHLSLVK